MANEVRLEAYYISIRDIVTNKKTNPGTDSPYYYMGRIKGQNFLDMFKLFMVNHTKSHERDLNLQKTFHIISESTKQDINIQKNYISGIIESGEYGISSKIKNKKGTTVHSKNPSESSDIPYYFLMYAPKGKKKAILLIQRTGVHGAFKIFEKKLKRFIIDRFSGVKVEVTSLVSKEVAKRILGTGIAKKVTLTKHVKKSDIFDTLGDGYSNDGLTNEGALMELSLTSRGNGYFNVKNNIDKFIAGKGIASFGLQDHGFTGVFGASVKVKHNGRYRTIDLKDSLNIKPYYDLESEGLKKDKKDKHPIFNSINKISLEILQDLIEEEKY